MGRKHEIIFFDNYDTDSFCTEDDARASIMENINGFYDDYESEDDIPDDEIWREIRFAEEFAWDDFEIGINRCMEDATYLVTGTVGTWYGALVGGCFVENVGDIIRKCCSDCEYFKFYEQNGHFYIKASHHDGTNYMEMKRVSDRGMEYYRNNEHDFYERELHEKMWNSNFMTSLPHFGKKLGYTKAV